jgi:hypothetical protein
MQCECCGKRSDDFVPGGATGDVANPDNTVVARVRLGSSIDKEHALVHIVEVR